MASDDAPRFGPERDDGAHTDGTTGAQADGMTDEEAERRERLKQQAAEARQEKEQEHQALMQAVAEGEELGADETAWVELGGADIEVRTVIPGRVTELFERAEQTEDAETVAEANDGVAQFIKALTEMTVTVEANGVTWDDTADVRAFYRGLYDEYGAQGLLRASDRVLTPAEENTVTEDAIDGFRATQ